MDAARGDRMSYAGYGRETTPFLASLADDHSLVALRHFSQGAATRSAIPRLLYSRYFVPPLFPGSSKIPIEGPHGLFSRLDEHAMSIPELFALNGYRTVGVSAHSWMRPGTQFVTLFEQFQDLSATQSGAYPEAPAVVDAALDAIRTSEGPGNTFLYLHLMDAHLPYRFGNRAAAFYGEREAPADTFLASGAPRNAGRSLSPRERDYYDALYDGSLRRIDDQLRRFMEQAVQLPAWGNISMVVTSDHGEHLGEVPGRSTHGGRWFDAVAHIPLLISAPGSLATKTVVERPTESVDVLPTLADLFGLAVPEGVEFDGASLEGGETDAIAMAPDAIRTASEKLLGVEPDIALWTQEAQPEFFLLEEDPLELEDRFPDHVERATELMVVHQELMSRSFHRFRNARSNTPPDLPFAIASKDFSLLAAQEDNGDSQAEWTHVRDTSRYQLSCLPAPCADIQISFPMPNGDYQMTVGFLGSGELRVAGGGADGHVSIRGDGPLPAGILERSWRHEVSTATYGSVRIDEQRFSARVSAPAGPGLVIRYFGFIPDDAEVSPDQESYEARLRALGYLQ